MTRGNQSGIDFPGVPFTGMETPVIDLRRYLTPDGECADMPDDAFAEASFRFAIVEWVSMAGLSAASRLTNVTCQQQVNRRRCRGPILATLDHDLDIAWRCGMCGNQGSITHWQGTLWDRRGPEWVPPPPPRC